MSNVVRRSSADVVRVTILPDQLDARPTTSPAFASPPEALCAPSAMSGGQISAAFTASALGVSIINSPPGLVPSGSGSLAAPVEPASESGGFSGDSIKLDPVVVEDIRRKTDRNIEDLPDNPSVKFNRTLTRRPPPAGGPAAPPSAKTWGIDYLLDYPEPTNGGPVSLDGSACCSPACMGSDQTPPYLPERSFCASLCSCDSSRPRKSFPLCFFREPAPPPKAVITTFPFPEEDCCELLRLRAELKATQQSHTLGVLSAIGAGLTGPLTLIPIAAGPSSSAFTLAKGLSSLVSGGGSIFGIWKANDMNQRKTTAQTDITALIIKLKAKYREVAGVLLERWVNATPLFGRNKKYSVHDLMKGGLSHEELENRRRQEHHIRMQVRELKLKLDFLKADMAKYPIPAFDIGEIVGYLTDAIAFIDRSGSMRVLNNSMLSTYTALRDDWEMQLEDVINAGLNPRRKDEDLDLGDRKDPPAAVSASFVDQLSLGSDSSSTRVRGVSEGGDDSSARRNRLRLRRFNSVEAPGFHEDGRVDHKQREFAAGPAVAELPEDKMVQIFFSKASSGSASVAPLPKGLTTRTSLIASADHLHRQFEMRTTTPLTTPTAARVRLPSHGTPHHGVQHGNFTFSLPRERQRRPDPIPESLIAPPLQVSTSGSSSHYLAQADLSHEQSSMAGIKGSSPLGSAALAADQEVESPARLEAGSAEVRTSPSLQPLANSSKTPSPREGLELPSLPRGPRSRPVLPHLDIEPLSRMESGDADSRRQLMVHPPVSATRNPLDY